MLHYARIMHLSNKHRLGLPEVLMMALDYSISMDKSLLRP